MKLLESGEEGGEPRYLSALWLWESPRTVASSCTAASSWTSGRMV